MNSSDPPATEPGEVDGLGEIATRVGVEVDGGDAWFEDEEGGVWTWVVVEVAVEDMPFEGEATGEDGSSVIGTMVALEADPPGDDEPWPEAWGAATAAVGVVAPDPPCDEPAAPPPFAEGWAGVAHFTVIEFASGTHGVAGAESDAGRTTCSPEVELELTFAEGPRPAGVGTDQAASAGSAGRRGVAGASTAPASAREAISAAGMPIPAIMIPIVSVIMLRCSIASSEWIRKANWA